MKKLISILLIAAMAVSLMCGSLVTGYADEEPAVENAVEVIEPAAEPAPEAPAGAPEAEPVPEAAPEAEPVPEAAPEAAGEPVAEPAEEPVLDGKTNVSTVTFEYKDGVLSVVGGVDADGVELGPDSFSLTDQGEGTYKLSMSSAAKSNYSMSSASFVLADPAAGTLEVTNAGNGNYTAVFTPAEGGETPAEGGETPAEGGSETPASGGLTVGSTYALFFNATTYLLNDDGTLKTDTGSSYSTGNPRAAITPSAGANGGYVFTMAGASGGTTYVAVSGGAITAATSAPAGEWFYADGKLSYVEGDSTLYVTGDGLTMGAAQGSAVQIVPISADSTGGGGGGGGSNNTYSQTTTNPNLIYVDAPHWVNLSKGDHEATKTVTLKATFPDGVEAPSMTFTWSFGEQTKTETIPADKAVDGVFTSSFTVDLAGLEAGVYPVACAISYGSDVTEIIVSEPEAPVEASEGEDWSYTLGSNANLKVVTELRGKPTVTIDGTEVTVTDDTSTSPPTSYIDYNALEKLTAGVHTAVVTTEDGSESHELNIIDPNASTGGDAPALVDGNYLIGIESDGKFYAMSNAGDSVKAVEIDKSNPSAAEVWAAATASGLEFSNSEAWLYYSSSAVNTRSKSATAWTYADGHLYYTPAGGADKGSVFYVSGIADGAFTIAKDDPDSAATVSIIPTAGPSNTTAGESYTYTLGIQKDLVIPTDANGPHTVTLKGDAVEFTEDTDAATITIAADVIEALSAGSYTIAVTDKDEMIVTHKLTVQSPPSIDVNVNVILAKGVEPNSVITFSDVHETWDDVGTAIADTIISTGGNIPALIIATGDFNNNQLAGSKATTDETFKAYFEGCTSEIINRVSLQLGAIDTVWVSGNHDNGYATQYTNYNLTADLGINIDDYSSAVISEDSSVEGTGKISGTGIIFDTRSKGFKKNAETSKSIDAGLIVIGLNYEDGDAFASNNYGDGEVEGDADSVYKHIKAALDSAAQNYNGELIVISSHAGLHAVGVDEDSAQSASVLAGGNGYTICNAAAIVKLLNSYVEEYDMDIMWFFGHDHSKGEEEFVKLPGSTITSMGGTYGQDVEATEDTEAVRYTEDIELKFTYAHAGYVGSGAAGVHNNNYTYLTFDHDKLIREERVADGAQTTRAFMDEDATHTAGSTSAISFTVDRIADYTPPAPPADDKPDEPDGPQKPESTTKPSQNTKKADNNPKTGDETDIAIWAVILVVCGTAVVAILPRKKLYK